MKRTLRCVALLAVLALLGAACKSESTSAAASGGAPLPGAGKTVCFVADVGGVNDKSFNQQIYEGLQQAQTDLGVGFDYVTSKGPADYAPFIQDYVNQDCELIVLAGFTMGDALVKSAKANPDQLYTIVDYDIVDFSDPAHPKDVTLPNVSELTFQTDEAAFLAGYLAAAETKTKVVAAYGGWLLPTVVIFLNGFAAGIRKYNQDNNDSVKLLGWDPETQKGVEISTDPQIAFYTPAEGRRVGEDFLAENADIILPVAGGTGIGTMAAAQDAGGAYGIWVDTDGCIAAQEYCSIFLTTVEKHMNVAVEDTVKAALDGTFKGGLYVGTLANNGVGIAPYHDLESIVPQDLQAKIEELKQGIIDGTVSVDPADYTAS